jgi:Ca2+-binding EF-hand superfamily protein
LTSGELEKGLSIAIGVVKSKTEDWRLILEAMDYNSDGKIDFSEFITAAVNREKVV